jgi:hypothetical protein
VARYTPSRWFAPLALCAFGSAVGAGWMALRRPPEAASSELFGWIGVIVVCGILAIGFAALASRPAIEIHETHLLMTSVMTSVMTGVMEGGVAGRRAIPWEQIRRVDQVSWQARWHKRWGVLGVVLTLEGGSRLWVVHAGGFDSGRSLLRHLRLCSREALLDGIPYRQFWGQGKPERSDSEHARSEYARPEGVNRERVQPDRANPERANPERAPLRARLKYPLLLAEDEAEIEHMFQRLKSAGRLEPHGHDTGDTRDPRGDASLDSRASGEGQG